MINISEAVERPKSPHVAGFVYIADEAKTSY
jgi:hypothetical protein